jgi:hypothetical protein
MSPSHTAAGGAVLAAITVCCTSTPSFSFREFKLYSVLLVTVKVSKGVIWLLHQQPHCVSGLARSDSKCPNTKMPLQQHIRKLIQNKNDWYLTASSIQIWNHSSSQSSSKTDHTIFFNLSKYKAEIFYIVASFMTRKNITVFWDTG